MAHNTTYLDIRFNYIKSSLINKSIKTFLITLAFLVIYIYLTKGLVANISSVPGLLYFINVYYLVGTTFYLVSLLLNSLRLKHINISNYMCLASYDSSKSNFNKYFFISVFLLIAQLYLNYII